jgi:hypothetical protein
MISLDSFDFLWMRIVPPILVALAWRLSGAKLVPEYDGLRSWKFLGLAVSVVWLASIGYQYPDAHAAWFALVIGVMAGFGVQAIPQDKPPAVNYAAKLLYALMHACITASIGLFLFLALKSRT